MTKVKNKAVKYNKNAEALLTFGLPFSYNHRRRPVRRKNNHLPPGGFPEAERRKEAIDEADMELISSDSLSVCEITLHRCDKEDAPECGNSHDGRNTDCSD